LNKIAIFSLSGLGNSLLTALSLKNSSYLGNLTTIYLTNSFSKSIFQYYVPDAKFKIYKKKKYIGFGNPSIVRLFLILLDLIISGYEKIIIEPNSSPLIIKIIKFFLFKKVHFIMPNLNKPIENEYQELFNYKNNILNPKNFEFNNDERVVIYPCVENIDKYSKKITEEQVRSIIESLNENKIKFKIIVPKYEAEQLSSLFKSEYIDSIEYIDKFDNFNILLKYFKQFDVYIGGDTFYYHIMSKSLEKKSYVIFGSTSYSRFNYTNELTKYFYPNCPNYPKYEKYFSAVNYCNYCKAEYCIEKVEINLFK